MHSLRPLLLCCLGLVAGQADRAVAAPRFEKGTLRGRIFGEVEGSQWALAEDAQGRIYSSGNHGVAVFDGEVWTRLPLPNAGELRGLAIDAAGRVWVGSAAELGCFTPLADGSHRFHSIRAHLPAEHENYGQLWAAYVVEDAVFFVADQKVLRWRDERFSVWNLPSIRRLFSSQVGNQLYLQARGTSGLWRIGARDPQPTLVAPTEAIVGVAGGSGFIALLPESAQSLLVLSSTAGVFRLGTEGKLARAGWPSQAFFEGSQIEDACRLPGGGLAVATWRAGVVLTDDAGRPIAQINSESGGLPSNRINRLIPASNHRLWVATRMGLGEWDTNPAVTYFSNRNGFAGEVSGFARYRDNLYVTTDNHLQRIAAAPGLTQPARIAPVGPIAIRYSAALTTNRQLTFMAQPESLGRRLLFAEMDGVLRVEDGQFDRIVFHLTPTDEVKGVTGFAELSDQRAVASYAVGLAAYAPDADATWRLFSLTPLPQCRQVLAEPGQTESALTRTFLHEIWRVTLPARREGDTPPGKLQCVLPRAQAQEIHQFFARDDALFAYTTNGTWRLAPTAAAFVQTEPARPEDWLWAGGAAGLATGWKLRRLAPAASAALTSPLYALHRAQPDPAVGWRAAAEPAALVNDVGTFRTALAETDGVVWLGGTAGIVRLDTKELPAPTENAPAVSAWRWARAQGRLLPLGGNAPLALPAGSDLEIDWSAPRADRFMPELFQSRLEGLEPEWSAPSRESMRRLERLHPGRYSLAVRTCTPLGQVGPALTLPFIITPAWYQTGGALALGLAFSGIGFWALVTLRTRGLRQRQRELEAAVQRRTNELQATKDVLHQAAHAKTEFISTVSHELRTPLTGARMMADLLLQAPLDPATRHRAANLRGCLSYLQTMLDETLDLSRLELGHVSYRLTHFQLGRLIGETRAMFEAFATKKGLAYDLELGRWEQGWYRAESTHLQRVLLNYLSNALKFTAQGSITLTVSAAPSGPPAFETLRFTVTDTGAGVAPEVQERIFRAFVRHRDPLSQSDTPGTGLGLALCRQLAELSGGQVGFTSKPGVGASFWVDWPLLPAKPDPDEGAIGQRDLSSLRVLVVEDDPSLLESTILLLQELGVVAETARTVDEAEAQMRRQVFAVVLVDYNLGGATGLDLLARCRAVPGYDPAVTRFHLVTAHSSAAVRASAQQAGITSFHSKPISLPALYSLLAASVTPATLPPPAHDH